MPPPDTSQRFEAKVEIAVLAALRRLIDAIASLLTTWRTVAPDEAVSTVWPRLLDEQVRPKVAEVLQEAGDDLLRLLSDDRRSWANVNFSAQVERLVDRVDDMGREVAEEIGRSLTEGVQSGEGYDELRDRVREAFPSSEARARTIARTETHSAVSEASQEAAQVVVDSGIELRRTWLATDDARVRESHWEANGQERSMGAAFHVGEAFLRFPGDPSGPPEEVIQCRCSLTFEPVDE